MSATNPETGSTPTSYEYHDSGDLRKKTDPRGVWSEMTYDGLHRIYGKTYSDTTPAVEYRYHLVGVDAPPNIGQLKSVSSGVAVTTYFYDALGKVEESGHHVGGHQGDPAFSYDWYLSGALKRMIYPSGRTVDYDVDDAGRTTSVHGSATVYADLTAPGITSPYTADGRIAQMKLGNNRWETRDYRTPGETTYYRLGSVLGAGDIVELGYNFAPTTNNGNVMSQTIVRPGHGVWSQAFGYDGVNRLQSALEDGGVWSEAYGYDQKGNRWTTAAGLPVDAKEPTSINDYEYWSNRLIRGGAQHDTAGNQTTYGPCTLGYDAESRTTTITSPSNGGGTYWYDGDGRRVKKVWTPAGGATATTYYFYNALGQLAAEYSSEAPNTTGTTYMFSDMLGSVRAITSQTGAVTECYDYLPFGRMLNSSTNGRASVGCHPANPDNQLNSSIPQKFTGKERDAETGLDFFLARYYSGAQGRFLSPDEFKGGPDDAFTGKDITPPGPLPYADIGNPQSLNKYAYVYNNPLRYTDPDGHEADEQKRKKNAAAVSTSTGTNTAIAMLNYLKDILYFKAEGGIGLDLQIKLGGIKGSVGVKSKVSEVRIDSSGNTKKEVSEVGLKVGAGKYDVGFATTGERLLATNDQVMNNQPTVWSPTVFFSKATNSDIGLVGIGGYALFGGGIELGIKGDKVAGDINTLMQNRPPMNEETRLGLGTLP